MRDVGTLIVSVLTVWLLVYAARRTNAPWWKIWLLARGIVPTMDEISAAEEKKGR